MFLDVFLKLRDTSTHPSLYLYNGLQFDDQTVPIFAPTFAQHCWSMLYDVVRRPFKLLQHHANIFEYFAGDQAPFVTRSKVL